MILEPLQILVSALLFAGVFLLVWALFRFPVPAEPALHRRVAVALGMGRRRTVFEQPALAPLMSFTLTLARRFTFRAVRERIRRDLDAAGNPNAYSVEEYLAIALACGVGLGLAAGAVAFAFLGAFDPLVILAMTFVGFWVPLYTLREAASARVRRIGKKLPYTLDLVALMMAAGSTFPEAIETIVRDEPGDDFNRELRIVQAEIEFGTGRAAALRNMAERIPLDTLRSVVGAVNQAEALGTPLSEILKNQSATMRMHRSVRAEKLSASASLRILVPSMLILMAVVLTVLAPFVIQWVRGRLF